MSEFTIRGLDQGAPESNLSTPGRPDSDVAAGQLDERGAQRAADSAATDTGAAIGDGSGEPATVHMNERGSDEKPRIASTSESGAGSPSVVDERVAGGVAGSGDPEAAGVPVVVDSVGDAGDVVDGGFPEAAVEDIAGVGDVDRVGDVDASVGDGDPEAGARQDSGWVGGAGGVVAGSDPEAGGDVDEIGDGGDPDELAAVEDEEDAEGDPDPDAVPVGGDALLIQEGEIAGDYLEQLLDILDYDGDIDMDVEGGRAVVAIVGASDLDPLVGSRGVTLDALQELTRLSVAQQTGVRTRLMLDVGGYRAERRTELSQLAVTSVTRVIDSGERLRLNPMNAFERKIVHDVVTATEGVRSESEGEDPERRVVILPDR